MELFDEKFNEVCAKWAVVHFMREGFTLKPQEVKRDLHNRAKEWGVPVKQVAEAHKVLASFLFEKTVKEIDKIISMQEISEFINR
jgi:hypothetical protein